MQHQLKLMALGESGGGRDSSLIYDGSDGKKSFRAISFVGKEKAPGSISRDKGNPAAGGLMTLGSWPMTISYFPVEDGEDTPEYQVSFDMYANGVATGLVLDYGDFALSGTLRDLTLLDKSECP
jgi:EipB-like